MGWGGGGWWGGKREKRTKRYRGGAVFRAVLTRHLGVLFSLLRVFVSCFVLLARSGARIYICVSHVYAYRPTLAHVRLYTSTYFFHHICHISPEALLVTA